MRRITLEQASQIVGKNNFALISNSPFILSSQFKVTDKKSNDLLRMNFSYKHKFFTLLFTQTSGTAGMRKYYKILSSKGEMLTANTNLKELVEGFQLMAKLFYNEQ